MKFDVLIKEYTCKLKPEDADCEPWKTDNLLDAMLLKKVNCDEDTAKSNEAIELLGDMEANNEAIQKGLEAIATC